MDIDIITPGSDTAVENITWTNLSKMEDGRYRFYVNNYNGVNTCGFRAQIEFNNTIYDYNCPKQTTKNVDVAIVTLKDGKFTIDEILESSTSQKEEWNIKTNNFQKVKTIMYSPNYWDNNNTGNKHYMFMLDNCENSNSTRGLYNEFLNDKLKDDRKVFETLGSILKCEPDTQQLSGLGFSSTQRNSIIVKVTGAFNRMLKIKF